MNVQLLLKTSLIAVNSFVSLLNSRFLSNAFPSIIREHRDQILIYLDKGVSLQSAYGAMFYTKMLYAERYQVEFTNARHLLGSESWESNTALLIFPGGRARPYYDSLKATWQPTVDANGMRRLGDIGEGNKRIQNYVTSGGAFLGICAGAYYGSASTVFEKGGPLEIQDEGALKFFSGTAIGPVYGNNKFSYWNKRGVQIAQIKSSNINKNLNVYFNGGCLLKPNSEDSMTEIIARYDDVPGNPPAVISCQSGKGRVVLSGIHFEITYWMIPFYSLMHQDFFKKNYASQSANIKFFNNTIQKLLMPENICNSEIKHRR